MEEYFVYFPFFILRHGSKRLADQPQAIYSEVPKTQLSFIADSTASAAVIWPETTF